LQSLGGASEAAREGEVHGAAVLLGDLFHLLGQLASGEQNDDDGSITRRSSLLFGDVHDAGKDEAERLA
jgi:hypothetical protein